MVRVLFFGKLADAAGGREREIAIGSDVATVEDLIRLIGKADQLLGNALKSELARIIVNEKIENHTCAIHDGDEIAFLPPVSGG